MNGRVVTGANAIAGEWGHNPLPWPEAGEWPGPPCYCGRTGCIETLLSGPGLARDHQGRTGRELDAAGIVAAAAAGDEDARESVATYERRLARGLASVVNVFDPDAIVLGGGVSNIARLYERVPRLWTEFVFSDAIVDAARARRPRRLERRPRRGVALGLVFPGGASSPGLPLHARSRGPRRPAPLAWLTRSARSPSPIRSLARHFAGALPPR